MVLSHAWVSHLPNNYADDPASTFGKVRLALLFINAGASAPGVLVKTAAEWSRTRSVRPKRWRDIDRYLVLPNKIIEGLRWRLGYKR